jgi:hypothetical protein
MGVVAVLVVAVGVGVVLVLVVLVGVVLVVAVAVLVLTVLVLPTFAVAAHLTSVRPQGTVWRLHRNAAAQTLPHVR